MALSLAGYMTWGKLLDISILQFPHLQNRDVDDDDNNAKLIEFCED